MFRKLSLFVGLLAVLVASPAFAAVNISGEPASGITVSGSHVTITQSGSYWLTATSTGDITVGSSSNTAIVVTLDLKGCSLSSTNATDFPHLIYNYANLTLIDSSEGQTGTIDGKEKYIGSSGRGIYNRGILYFKSGTIQNCYSYRAGGGISNLKGATAYMRGGTIKDCRSDSQGTDAESLGGGGVYNAGTFYFEGGTIKDCVAKSHNGCTARHLGGGGIYNHGGDDSHKGMLYMSGGTIENCIVARNTDYSGVPSRAHGGGGVLNVGTGASTLPTDRGVFEMTGGTIKSCQVKQYKRGCGGGVFNAEGTFNLKGGTIGGDSDADGNFLPADGSSYGGGICSRGEYFTDRTGDSPKSQETNAYFEMTGGTVAYNRSPCYAGGGICLNFGSAVITGGLITHNTAGAIGGGIIGGNATNVTFGGTAVVSYNKVTDAHTYSDPDCGGGGIAVGKASGNNVFTMTGGAVIYNTCDGKGGGFYMRDVEQTGTTNDVRIEGGLIAYNESGTAHNETYAQGGGIFTNGNVTITGGEISNNTSYTNGGGLFMGSHSKRLEMSGGVIKENTARYDGGGIYITGGASLEKVEFTGGEFNDNTSNKNGGGFYLAKGNVTINSNNNEFKVINNHAVNTNSGGYGGGFYVNNGNLSIESTSNDLQINRNEANIDGGGFYVNGGSVTITGGTIQSNTATTGNGGGFYSAGGTVNISKATVSANHAEKGFGGGFYSAAGITVGTTATGSGATVSGNHAKNGAGFYVAQTSGTTTTIQGGSTISDNIATEDGAGAYIASGNLSILFSDIKKNEATRNGGGIYASASSVVTMSDGDIADNQAKNGGGIYLTSGAEMTMSNGLIRYNKAVSAEGATLSTAYHAGNDPSLSIQGVGGGIYLSAGTSNKTKLTFELPKTVGIYGNTATLGADEIFADGLRTQITVPEVEGMTLSDYPATVDGWYEDYITDDTRYAAGTNIAPAWTPVRRYEDYIANGENPYLVPYTTASGANKYICLRLGGMTSLIITKTGMAKGETAIFKVSKPSAEIQKILYTVSITAGDDGSGSATIKVPMGEYTVQETDWSWAYAPDASDGKITQDISRDNTFTFTNTPKENVPLHGESYKNNVFGTPGE